MPPFDMSLVQRGARNRRTPYYEATQKYSPKAFTVYNHMYFPIRFDTFENEFQALLNDVTIWDVSVERCIEVSGPDGFKFAQLLDAAQPLQVRRGPGQVRPDLRLRRRRHQRPGHDPHGREHVLVRAGLLRRAAVRQGPEERLPEAQRHAARARRGPAAGPGPQVEEPDERPRGQRHSRPEVLLVDEEGDHGRPGRHHAHRLDERGRLRDLPARPDEGHGDLGSAHGGRQALRRQADRSVGHPPDRGRHPELGRRHDLREQRRSSSASSVSSTSTCPTTRASRSPR